eukprot:gene8275-biopygen1576
MLFPRGLYETTTALGRLWGALTEYYSLPDPPTAVGLADLGQELVKSWRRRRPREMRNDAEGIGKRMENDTEGTGTWAKYMPLWKARPGPGTRPGLVPKGILAEYYFSGDVYRSNFQESTPGMSGGGLQFLLGTRACPRVFGCLDARVPPHTPGSREMYLFPEIWMEPRP